MKNALLAAMLSMVTLPAAAQRAFTEAAGNAAGFATAREQ